MFFDRKWVETEYGAADFVKVEKSVKSIINQRHLARIAKKAKAYELRKVAVELLTNQKVLLAIAKNDSSDDVRVAALERVTDSHEQSLIAIDIIANGKDDYVRIKAAETVKNRTEAQELFMKIVRKKPGICTVRAAELLLDKDAAQKALLRTAMECEYDDERIKAIQRITDQNMLYDIVRKSSSATAAFAAAKRLNNEKRQAAYKLIAMRQGKPHEQKIRYLAAEKLDNKQEMKKALESIMQYAQDQVQQQSGTYTWTDSKMLALVEDCRSLYDRLCTEE